MKIILIFFIFINSVLLFSQSTPDSIYKEVTTNYLNFLITDSIFTKKEKIIIDSNLVYKKELKNLQNFIFVDDVDFYCRKNKISKFLTLEIKTGSISGDSLQIFTEIINHHKKGNILETIQVSKYASIHRWYWVKYNCDNKKWEISSVKQLWFMDPIPKSILRKTRFTFFVN